MNHDKLIEIVEDFVEHFYAGDYTIDTISYTIRSNLTDALRSYVEAKFSMNKNAELECAQECLTAITEAREADAVKEAESLLTKLKKALKENGRFEGESLQLKEENVKLKKEVSRLKQLNEGLHQIIDNFGAKRPDSSQGDI